MTGRGIDDARVDIVHGHSSHHVKGIEVYKDKPIFYGCGDFLTDDEGIGGYESYRGNSPFNAQPKAPAAACL